MTKKEAKVICKKYNYVVEITNREGYSVVSTENHEIISGKSNGYPDFRITRLTIKSGRSGRSIILETKPAFQKTKPIVEEFGLSRLLSSQIMQDRLRSMLAFDGVDLDITDQLV